MTWAIVVDPPAKRSLRKIPARDRERILDSIEEMRRDPFVGDTQKLKGEHEGFRRRIGPWRVFFDVEHDTRTVYVTGIERRTSTTY